ncbi:DUF456 domain-containing protein [Staphylococcus sp. 17KM0847]|uniref:DUF456 domain-containing protein n=1 Tax=Staphylococcus sp. 17KM0847 TaxID=2583989 RepID=UPI0015DC4D56|nr:DUF456 domain-containing protein [Staphylococcus sp. 17KM0847]QLK86936.1 DUF456 domain-containing protein [Staphylococcus sp. 17KM0847]
MSVVLWILVLMTFIMAFVGLVKPVIPAVLMLWIGFFIYYFGIDRASLSLWFWGAMLLWTLFILMVDIFLSRYFVTRFGGSKQAEYAAWIGVIVGTFILPPFGIMIVPFVAVLVIEYIQKRHLYSAIKVSVGAVVAFFSSTLVQALVMLMMVTWFFIDALWL